MALPAMAAGATASGSGALSVDATIDIQVRVPEVMRLAFMDHPATLHITAEDSARGEVSVEGARILLLANTSRGFSLLTELAADFSAAFIDGLAVPVHATPGSGSVPMPSMVGRPRPVARLVQYRFRFPRGLAPGRYPWPLALSVTRL
jgi:hypothetical protein